MNPDMEPGEETICSEYILRLKYVDLSSDFRLDVQIFPSMEPLLCLALI